MFPFRENEYSCFDISKQNQRGHQNQNLNNFPNSYSKSKHLFSSHFKFEIHCIASEQSRTLDETKSLDLEYYAHTQYERIYSIWKSAYISMFSIRINALLKEKTSYKTLFVCSCLFFLMFI